MRIDEPAGVAVNVAAVLVHQHTETPLFRLLVVEERQDLFILRGGFGFEGFVHYGGLFAGHHLEGGLHDVRGVKPVLGHQFGGFAAFAEVVVHGHHLDGGGEFAAQQLADTVAEAAVTEVLFRRDDATGLVHAAEDGFFVEGFDGMYVNNFCADTLLGEFVGGLEGVPYEVAGGDEGDIGAFVHHHGLADDERLVGGGEVRNGGASETEIDGSDVLGSGEGGLLGLVVVAGVDHHHVREHLHQAEVLHHLVGGAVLAHGDTGVGGGDFHVKVGVGGHHTDLVIDAAGDETCEGAGERHFAAEGETGGDADHVGFRDAGLDEPFGKFLDKITHLETADHIGAEGENIGVAVTRFQQARTEAGTGILKVVTYKRLHNYKIWLQR